MEDSSNVEPSTIVINLNDPLNIYCIHLNENPSLILVSPVLDGTNYHACAREMRRSLISKNKIRFVDGSILKPQEDDPLFGAWERCNTLVISWITKSLSPSIACSILWEDNAYEIWTDLQRHFSQGNAFRISDLQEEIQSFKQDDKSVNEYYTGLKILWDETKKLRPYPCCNCAVRCECPALSLLKSYRQSDYVLKFLKGLNDQYALIRSQIMLMEPLPDLAKVFSLVIQQERHNSILPSVDSKAFINSTGNDGAFPKITVAAFNNKQSNPGNSFGRGKSISITKDAEKLCTHWENQDIRRQLVIENTVFLPVSNFGLPRMHHQKQTQQPIQ